MIAGVGCVDPRFLAPLQGAGDVFGAGTGGVRCAQPPANFCHPYRGGSCRDLTVAARDGGCGRGPPASADAEWCVLPSTSRCRVNRGLVSSCVDGPLGRKLVSGVGCSPDLGKDQSLLRGGLPPRWDERRFVWFVVFQSVRAVDRPKGPDVRPARVAGPDGGYSQHIPSGLTGRTFYENRGATRNCWPVGPTNDVAGGPFPARWAGLGEPPARWAYPLLGGVRWGLGGLVVGRRRLCSPALSGTPFGVLAMCVAGDRGWSWIGLKPSAWGRSLAWIKNRSPFPCR